MTFNAASIAASVIILICISRSFMSALSFFVFPGIGCRLSLRPLAPASDAGFLSIHFSLIIERTSLSLGCLFFGALSPNFLPISFDESLLIRLLVSCLNVPASVWTSLHNLFAFVHPKVVSVFPQHTSQAINGYNHFCYHISLFLVTLLMGSPNNF